MYKCCHKFPELLHATLTCSALFLLFIWRIYLTDILIYMLGLRMIDMFWNLSERNGKQLSIDHYVTGIQYTHCFGGLDFRETGRFAAADSTPSIRSCTIRSHEQNSPPDDQKFRLLNKIVFISNTEVENSKKIWRKSMCWTNGSISPAILFWIGTNFFGLNNQKLKKILCLT